MLFRGSNATGSIYLWSRFDYYVVSWLCRIVCCAFSFSVSRGEECSDFWDICCLWWAFYSASFIRWKGPMVNNREVSLIETWHGEQQPALACGLHGREGLRRHLFKDGFVFWWMAFSPDWANDFFLLNLTSLFAFVLCKPWYETWTALRFVLDMKQEWDERKEHVSVLNYSGSRGHCQDSQTVASGRCYGLGNRALGEMWAANIRTYSPHRTGWGSLLWKPRTMTVNLVLPLGEAGVPFLGLCPPLAWLSKPWLAGCTCFLWAFYACVVLLSALCCEDWAEKQPELRLQQWCCSLEHERGNSMERSWGLGGSASVSLWVIKCSFPPSLSTVDFPSAQ